MLDARCATRGPSLKVKATNVSRSSPTADALSLPLAGEHSRAHVADYGLRSHAVGIALAPSLSSPAAVQPPWDVSVAAAAGTRAHCAATAARSRRRSTFSVITRDGRRGGTGTITLTRNPAP
eukprot:scaffold7377_cov389-Prasinococcus_capsulatus_cf.AAC.2